MSVYSRVWLVQVTPESWSRVPADGAPSLQEMLERISAGARRMAKGPALGEARGEFLVLARQVAEAARTLHNPDRDWPVPETLLPAWSDLLAILARCRAEMAARSLGRQHALPFLPALFAPAGAGGLRAGPYGSTDVGSHLGELAELARDLVADPSRQPLASALANRRHQFGAAATAGRGLVEWVEPQAWVWSGA